MNNYMKIIMNAMKQWTTDGLNRKVDKVPGKGLSTEDFTSELKNKLESMTPGSGGSGTGGGVDVQNAVLYVEQTLNADQRAQARENIGVEEEIAESLLALEIVKTFGDEDGAIAEDGTVLVARNDELFLPPVNEENEGNVLTVVDGKWAVEPVEFAGGDGPADLKDLTFTGAVNAVYDGSRAVSIEIPEAPVKSVNGMTGEVNLEIPSIDGLASEKYVDDSIAAIPKVEAPVASVNGMTGDVVIDVPSIDGLATEEYVNEAIGAIEFPDAPVTSVNGMTGDITIEIPEGFGGSWNDLTDKPFGQDGGFVEWGDNLLEHIENRAFMAINNNGDSRQYYKVSDLTPTAADLIGGTLTYGSSSMELREWTIVEDRLTQGDKCLFGGEFSGFGFAVIYDTACSCDDMRFLEGPSSTGIYFEYAYMSETVWSGAKAISWGDMTVHQLDEKFIPDSIARVENVVTSVNGMTGDVTIAGGAGGSGSWNELTEKPFYDIEPVCEPIYENVVVTLSTELDLQGNECLSGTVVEEELNNTIVAGEKYRLTLGDNQYFGIATRLPPVYPIPEHHKKHTGVIVNFYDDTNNLIHFMGLVEPYYYYDYNGTIAECIDINYNEIGFASYDFSLGETVTISLDRVITDAKKIDLKYTHRADWDENEGTKPEYIKNRPFYKDQHITEELIFDGKYKFDSTEGYNLPSPFDDFKDESYIVEWDGIRYDCRAQYRRDVNYNELTLGFRTGLDSFEAPFSLFAGNSKEDGIMWAYLKELTEPGEVHRCKIYRKHQSWIYDQDYIYTLQPDQNEDNKNSINYIKNRICSKIDKGYRELANVSNPVYINSSSLNGQVVYATTVPLKYNPIEYQSYDVKIGSNWEYDLPCIGDPANSDEMALIGNPTLFLGNERLNTGESVLVIFNYPSAGTAYVVTTYSDGGQIKISGPACEYKPMSELYLPSYVPRALTAKIGDVLVVADNAGASQSMPTQWRAASISSLIPATNWDAIINKPFGEEAEKVEEIFNQGLDFASYGSGLYVAQLDTDTFENLIVPGETYVINWDGEEYTCVESMAEEPGDLMVLGNTELAIGVEGNTNEPFCILILPGQTAMVATTSTDNWHHLEIHTATLNLVCLDDKYLSGSVAKAATAQVGQTLIVKAIDENGKPTEWECVDMPTWIPNFTESDEGAVLKIVNGTPTWVSET